MTATYALIPAAGRAVRFSTDTRTGNKVLAPLSGRTVLRWTVEIFAEHQEIDGIIVVGASSEISALKSILSGVPKVMGIVAGGASRQESVWIGLFALGGNADDTVLVHDGARPLVTSEIIDRCLAGVREFGNAVIGLPVTDTLKRVSSANAILETVDREGLWAVQTPQAFSISDLSQAQIAARDAGVALTDEAALIEQFGSRPVHMVLGSSENLKITHPEDLALAEAILRRRFGNGMSESRVGFGYDIHPLVHGRKVILGGIEIPSPDGRGLEGHSDADVLLHAICDALLGAAGLPDIGNLFPNTDNAYKGIASTRLLKIVGERVRELGYTIVNVDSTVIAEAPKIGPYVGDMRSAIAGVLAIDASRVGIKATTNEGLGSLGSGMGIAAHAVAGIARSV